MRRDGAEPVGSTPDELAAKLRREVDRYNRIIKTAKIRPD